MHHQSDTIRRFHAALPHVRRWIDELLETHAANARRVDTARFPQLASALPDDLLEQGRMVLVDRTPYPPVSKFGLPELAALEQRQFDGITFKNTFFIVNGRDTERLQFH